jgi:hypothetical protein
LNDSSTRKLTTSGSAIVSSSGCSTTPERRSRSRTRTALYVKFVIKANAAEKNYPGAHPC